LKNYYETQAIGLVSELMGCWLRACTFNCRIMKISNRIMKISNRNQSCVILIIT